MPFSTRFSYGSLTPAQRARLRDLLPAGDRQHSPPPSATDRLKDPRPSPTRRSSRSISNDAQMQSSLLDYFRAKRFDGIAVTLTFRRARPPEFLTEDIARAAVQELLKRLNKFAVKRKNGNPLRVIAVREGGTSSKCAVRLHYHLKIEIPPGISGENFGRKVEQYWVRLKWANRQNDITTESDDGWLTYILKRRSKLDFADGIDWMNTHV